MTGTDRMITAGTIMDTAQTETDQQIAQNLKTIRAISTSKIFGTRVLPDRATTEATTIITKLKYKIRFAQAGRRPPIVNLRSPQIERNHVRFYIDIGVDVSLIKKNKINTKVPIDQDCVVSISGVTPGECAALGSFQVEISDFLCEAHVVPEDFPIDTDGLLGWDMLTRHEAKKLDE